MCLGMSKMAIADADNRQTPLLKFRLLTYNFCTISPGEVSTTGNLLPGKGGTNLHFLSSRQKSGESTSHKEADLTVFKITSHLKKSINPLVSPNVHLNARLT